MVSAFQKVVFHNYCNFNGRARRPEYWWFALDSFIIESTLKSPLSGFKPDNIRLAHNPSC